MMVSLAAIACPVVYWGVASWIKRRRHKRFQNLGYLAAWGTVNDYIKYAAKGGGTSTANAILNKFKELCPEGVPVKAVYDGYLLNAWIRFNAAELLIKNQNEFKGLPETEEKLK